MPTPTRAPSGPDVRIVAVDKREEYVDVQNYGDQLEDLAEWVLVSERGGQMCELAGVLGPGMALRIWAMAADAGRVREIEAEIDRLAAKLWGLSKQELEEIQRSLEELR